MKHKNETIQWIDANDRLPDEGQAVIALYSHYVRNEQGKVLHRQTSQILPARFYIEDYNQKIDSPVVESEGLVSFTEMVAGFRCLMYRRNSLRTMSIYMTKDNDRL